MKRVIIIGDAGRGKSTMAEKLSQRFGVKHYSTDDFYYEVKFDKPRDKQEALGMALRAYGSDSWIVEGTTQWLLTPGLDLAEKIIYLRYKNIFSQFFTIIRRHLTRKDESLKNVLWLLRHVFYKRYRLAYTKSKPTHQEVINPHKDKVVILSSFKEIDDFLCNLK